MRSAAPAIQAAGSITAARTRNAPRATCQPCDEIRAQRRGEHQSIELNAETAPIARPPAGATVREVTLITMFDGARQRDADRDADAEGQHPDEWAMTPADAGRVERAGDRDGRAPQRSAAIPTNGWSRPRRCSDRDRERNCAAVTPMSRIICGWNSPRLGASHRQLSITAAPHRIDQP
jgi:hypothetical protein